jgi:hypothetical protein
MWRLTYPLLCLAPSTKQPLRSRPILRPGFLCSDWNVPDSRTDLKWHAMVRLYNAFCVHAVLPRFKLSTSLPLPLRDYLHTLVKGATEEVGALLQDAVHHTALPTTRHAALRNTPYRPAPPLTGETNTARALCVCIAHDPVRVPHHIPPPPPAHHSGHRTPHCSPRNTPAHLLHIVYKVKCAQMCTQSKHMQLTPMRV